LSAEPRARSSVAWIELTATALHAKIEARGATVVAYEVIDHTADLALRFRGATLEQLFEHAARGLFEYNIADVDQLAPSAERTLELRAAADDELLVDWLNELLFLLDARGEVHAWPHLDRVAAGALNGRSKYWQLERAAERRRNPVKAATYHDLLLERTDSGWVAEVLFDL
jgi:SHS2 domain-containing protein